MAHWDIDKREEQRAHNRRAFEAQFEARKPDADDLLIAEFEARFKTRKGEL